jgi:hypothetical protein
MHRGEILKAVVKRSGQKVDVVAKKAGFSRSTFYNHTRERELAWEKLEKYGIALQYDFTEDIPEMNKYTLKELPAKYTPRTFEEAIRQLDQVRSKYDQLNEKYTQLIEEHNDLHNKLDLVKDDYIQHLKTHKAAPSNEKSPDKS